MRGQGVTIDKTPTRGQLDELHQTIRDFHNSGIKDKSVQKIGGKFKNTNNEFDLLLIDGTYYEYKNKDFFTRPFKNDDDAVNQLINGYLKHIESFQKYQLKFGKAKLLYYGKGNELWSEASVLETMKKQVQQVFQGSKKKDIFDIIWLNTELRNSLWNPRTSQTAYLSYRLDKYLTQWYQN